MKFTKLQLLNMGLGIASLAITWLQGQVDGKMTEDYVREEVDRLLDSRRENVSDQSNT